MSRPFLTDDQRLLLFAFGGWRIVYALTSPQWGIPHLFDGQGGGTLHGEILEYRPRWAHMWAACEGQVLRLENTWDEPFPDGVSPVVITRARLEALAGRLPEPAVAELQRCLDYNRAVHNSDAGHEVLQTALRSLLGIDRMQRADEPADLLELLEAQG